MFVAAALLIGFALVFVLIKYTGHHKFVSSISELQQVTVPVSSDVVLGYGEANLVAPRVQCSAAAAGTEPLYPSPPETLVPAEATTPLPGSVSEAVSTTVTATLGLGNDGVLKYSLNGASVWTSTQPRRYALTAAMHVLLRVMVTPPDGWRHIVETPTGLRLHVVPLAITAPRNDGEGRRVVWTFVSGWDATALCASPTACEIPFAGSVAGGITALISADRAARLALLGNGDLVAVRIGADGPRSSTLSSTLLHSLMQASCRGA
jgi:hypothetical protein